MAHSKAVVSLHSGSPRTPAPDRPTARRWIRPVLLAFGGLVAALAIAAVVMVRDAQITKNALFDAVDDASALQTALMSGDQETAARQLTALREQTGRAASHTDGPLWVVAGWLPRIGDDVDAVRTATAAIDAIADQALPPLVGVSQELDSDLFKPRKGQFDLKAFDVVRSPLATASAVLSRQRVALEDLDQDQLIARLRGPVADLTTKVTTAQRATTAATTAVDLAPSMLGAEGPRTYLLVFQNNAELRSTGGIPGSMALVRARNGRLTIDDSFSKEDVGLFKDPVVKVTDDELATTGDTIATDYRDVNLTPDFPRSAAILRAMAEKQSGVVVDGVVSVDPVALSYALRGTGPVDVGDGISLNGDNAVDVLLNQVYERFDGGQQDAFFTVAAQRVFERILDGSGDTRTVIKGLADAADEHRILIWSAARDEQDVLADTPVGGSIRQGDGPPRVGVYLADATGSKLQYFLRWDNDLRAVRCEADGSALMQLTTRIQSRVPTDANQMPEYIGGPSDRGRRGDQLISVRLALPRGATVESFEKNRQRSVYSEATLLDRPFANTSVIVAAGGIQEVSVTFRVKADAARPFVLTTTPGVVRVDNGRRITSPCAP